MTDTDTHTDTHTRGHGALGIPPRYYDWLSGAAGTSGAHWQLVAQAAIAPHATVLEIGVGTGNVLLKVKRAAPDSIGIGLDPDPASLAFAAGKAARAGVELQLDRGEAAQLPYPDASVDRVLSSFMFHHIPDDQKLTVMKEVRRVLKPGGSLHLLDLTSRTRVPLPRFVAALHGSRHNGRRDGHHHQPRTVDPLAFMEQAGLTDPTCVSSGTSAFGRHALYRASRS